MATKKSKSRVKAGGRSSWRPIGKRKIIVNFDWSGPLLERAEGGLPLLNGKFLRGFAKSLDGRKGPYAAEARRLVGACLTALSPKVDAETKKAELFPFVTRIALHGPRTGDTGKLLDRLALDAARRCDDTDEKTTPE